MRVVNHYVMKRLAFIFVLIFGVGICAHPITLYNTCYNKFERLNFNNLATINGQFLQLDNSTTHDIIVVDSTDIDSFDDYKYYIKFANLHNKEGKTYKVRDEQDNSTTVSSTKCGIVFNLMGDSYWLVTACCSNSNLYNENFDSRTMTVELSRVTSGKKEVVEQVTLDKGVDLDMGYNYLGVQVENNTLKVIVGKNKLNEIFSHTIPNSQIEENYGIPSRKVGLLVGPGAMMSVERWVYLDRDMEDKWLKLGGRYTIALVETQQGYDVIYVDGAQVKKSQWHLGMKKGEMFKTIFTDNFTGKWNDATQEAINEDVYVTFESGVILTFKFPVYKSQIRFSKVLN